MTTARRTALGVALAMLGVALAAAPAARAAVLAPSISVSEPVLDPTISGGCYAPSVPCYTVSGVAEPGVHVEVTVTDDTGSNLVVVASTFAASQDDPGAGLHAGDWSVSPNVTDLGVHGEGSSVLTFTAVAKAGGQVSTPSSATAVKVARTEGDDTGSVVEPIPRSRTWPPPIWSRFVCIGCTPQETLCIQFGNCGQAPVRGVVHDDHAAARGVASEVADVVIVITNDAGEVWKELHSFSRRGTDAFYNAVLQIEDFPYGGYAISVKAFDAWGNVSNELRYGFQVIP